MSQSLRTRKIRVSLWVEPGKASAVLKLGLTRTSLPLTGFVCRASMERSTPVLRSVVRTRETRLVRLLLMAVPPPYNPNMSPPPAMQEYLNRSLRLMGAKNGVSGLVILPPYPTSGIHVHLESDEVSGDVIRIILERE